MSRRLKLRKNGPVGGRGRAAHGGRGFALPLAVMLVAVGSVLIAILIERKSAQTVMSFRQLDQYTSHHVSRGIQEGVEAWLRSMGGRDVEEALEPDGHAFDLIIGETGSQVVRISFEEAQGTILSELSGVTGDAQEMSARAIDRLYEEEGPGCVRHMRKAGPAAVSLYTASDDVLRALFSPVLETRQVSSLISEIKKARAATPAPGTASAAPAVSGVQGATAGSARSVGEGLRAADAVNAILVAAEVPEELRGKVGSVITGAPTLYRIRAESGSPVGGSEPVVYEGLVVVRSGGAGGAGALDTGGGPRRPSMVLSWERVRRNLGDLGGGGGGGVVR